MEQVAVAGPSHARRFRHAIATGQIARPHRSILWNDLAAASMLHPYFRECEFSKSPTPALVFVPDFRLGNLSLENPEDPEAYLSVEKRLITKECDALMCERVLERVDEVREANPRARFVFWCLGWRELNNRANGRYFDSGTYRHPIWNLSEVEGRFGDSVITLSSVFDHPMGKMLHIDGSGHPSYVGLELYRNLVDEPDVDVSVHLDRIAAYGARPLLVLPKDMVITGDSIWLKALELYISKGLVKLHPQTRIASQEDLLSGEVGQTRRVLYVSRMQPEGRQGRQDDGGSSLVALSALEKKGYDVLVFCWDSRAEEVLHPALRRARNHPASTAALARFLTSEMSSGAVLVEGPTGPSFIHPSDVEVSHGSGPWPTVQGIRRVIEAGGGVCRQESFSEGGAAASWR
ncbi:hypothetical protein ACXET9_09260 [Brachybacterium sp. DNPG3]